MKRSTWIILSVVAIAAGAAALTLPGRLQAWQQAHSLATTHITYDHFACAVQPCPAYQVDVFGDGTVIYQGFQDVAVRGAYIYHVPREDLQPYIRDFRVSSYWQKPHAGAATPAGGGCRVTMTSDRQTRRTGCLDVTGDDGLTLPAPQLSADIAQLEALVKLDALTRGRYVAGTTPSPNPVTEIKPYHASSLFPGAVPTPLANPVS